jgi:hypothetical protein
MEFYLKKNRWQRRSVFMEVPVGVPFPIHVFDRRNAPYHTFFYIGLTLPAPAQNPNYDAALPLQFHSISESGLLEPPRSPSPPASPPRRRRRDLENSPENQNREERPE